MAKRRSSNGHAAVLDIPVEFGGVSIGDKTARVGVNIPRDKMTLTKADEILCGHRLTGKIVARPPDESTEQQRLEGFEVEELAGAFDVKSFTVHAENFQAGLTFSKADIDLGDLSTFAKKAGRLVIDDVGELASEGDPEDDDDDDGGE